MFYFIALAGYNYWLDPYGIIKGNMTHQTTEPNLHYVKTKFILNNSENYNAFIFGSSRVGRLDITKISDNNTWYNFAYSQATPQEMLTDLTFMLKRGVDINKVMLGLEDIAFLVDPEVHKRQSLRKPYKSKFEPWLYYVFLQPSLKMYKYLRGADDKQFYTPDAYQTIYTHGCYSMRTVDDWIEENREEHINNPRFLIPTTQSYYKGRVSATIDEIEQIISLCRENDIELVLFMNPLHIQTYISMNMEHYYSFLKELSQIANFYDFSGINDVTTDNYRFYETSHFRHTVGDQMVDILLHPQNADGVYGMLVDSSNVDSVIDRKRSEKLEYDLRDAVQ